MFKSKEEILSQYELVNYSTLVLECITLVPKADFKVDGAQLWVRNEWIKSHRPEWAKMGVKGEGQCRAAFIEPESEEWQIAIDALLGAPKENVKVWWKSDLVRYIQVEFK